MLGEKDKEWMNVLIETRIDEKVSDKLPKEAKWVKWLRRWFMGLTPIAIIGAVWFSSSVFNEMKETRFDSASQKANVISHVNSAPDPIVLEAIRRHATDPGVHMPREAKDSTYVRSDVFHEYARGVNYDIYQMRKTINNNSNAQKEFLKKMDRNFSALEYKIDKALN